MKAINLLMLSFLILFAVSCSKESLDEDISVDNKEVSLTVPQDKQIELEVLNLINLRRQENGLNALEKLTLIKTQTETHTNYMVEINKMCHDNFLQRKTFLVINAKAQHVNENVAFGYNTAEGVVNAWLNSPNHRANIFGNFTHFDVSAKITPSGNYFFTNIFVRK